MKFKRYPSIENSYQQKHLNYLKVNSLTGGEWCVTEKIHGSNLGIYADADTCNTASRKHLLDDHAAELFFRFGQIKPAVYLSAINIFDYVVNELQSGDVGNIIVYGELFGGSYPHPDIPHNSKTVSIQKGVFYSPDIHFWVFDIQVVLDNGDEFFLDYDTVVRICEALSVSHCKILFRGSMKECLEYNNDDETTIPGIMGLPGFSDTENVMEGVVIKPIFPMFMNCGSRVILKNKNEKFNEKNRARGDKKAPAEVSKEAQVLIPKMAEYITEARLEAVGSKIGELVPKLIGQYIKDFSLDVFEDAAKDSVIPHHTDKGVQKEVRKWVSKECKKMILENM